MTIPQPSAEAAEKHLSTHAPLFRAGAWTTTPFAPYTTTDDWDEALKLLGFTLWMTTEGMTGCLDLLPLSLRVWARSEHPRYVIEVNTVDAFDHALTHDLPDLMDLLARWAPAIQAFAVAGLIGDANQISNDGGAQKSLIGLARNALGQPI